ncbi:DUF1186 domain-containing protein [uncultured Cytophaga sp.]|uniref:DUF1186 domain-containing protein n=1 Tax=uncultured Cytophaga sp. TaxID=160238 RepID=UPI0026025BA0|nr:DUF1186 domain-containing protein [uncultured Cytophaga sp.]
METEIQLPLPHFTHADIASLYNLNYEKASVELEKIILLPRESLLRDLESVLKDSVPRYEILARLNDENESDFDWDTSNAPSFALFMLAELEAKESLPAVLEFFSTEIEYFFDFYLGSMLGEQIWSVFYKIENENVELYKPFVFNPNSFTYATTEISVMVAQIALHHPERREEVIAWYKDVLEHFLSVNTTFDETLLGLIVADIMDVNGVELIPQIENLFEKDIVDYGVCGSFEDVKTELTNTINGRKRNVDTLAERCVFVNSCLGDQQATPDFASLLGDFKTPKPQAILPEPKVGRNDPCPCGSGKKYKKCCEK